MFEIYTQETYTGKPCVYFDMDGVLADYEKGAHVKGVNPKDYCHLEGAFINLEVYPGATDMVDYVTKLGYDVWILTKAPNGHATAKEEKYEWTRNNFPKLSNKVIITDDKSSVGNPCDYLIDDHPEWANAKNFPGKCIKFTGNWDIIKWSINPDSKVGNI